MHKDSFATSFSLTSHLRRAGWLLAFTIGLTSSVSAEVPARVSELVWSGTSRFSEPADGGNLDLTNTKVVGDVVTIVPRAHTSEAMSGQSRWRNVLFAMRGLLNQRNTFVLPLRSPGSGKVIHNQDPLSFANLKPVWSYDGVNWKPFDTYTRTGSSITDWAVRCSNAQGFAADVVFISINDVYPVQDYYAWLRQTVFLHPWVKPTASANATTFEIGRQKGATSKTAFNRTVPEMPLYAFRIADPAMNPTKVCILVAGQHPYEGQNKWALQGAIEFILSDDPAAVEYRRQYVTLVYPHVNPTGELAGLWRGTASDTYADTNRNWAKNARNVDTVNIHRTSLLADVAAENRGAPALLLDFHQTFQNVTGHVIRANSAITAGFLERLRAYYPGTEDVLTTNGEMLTLWASATLRAKCTLILERSVYSEAQWELPYGEVVIRAIVDYTAAGRL